MKMPQPATHYLVVRRSIPEEYWEEWWNDTYKKYFGLPKNFKLKLERNLKINFYPEKLW